MTDILQYSFEVRPLSDDEGSGWLISHPDLPGCIVVADTLEEAMVKREPVLAACLEAAKEHGHPIPEPSLNKWSGKFNFRTSKSTHARMAAKAKAEGISLNAYLNQVVNRDLGLPE